MFEEKIGELLGKKLGMKPEEVIKLLERPKPEFGDYAFPCFGMAMKLKENPFKLAQKIVSGLKLPREIEKAEAKGAYVNFFLNKKVLAENILNDIIKEKSKYGSGNEGRGKTVVVDFSAPNIAKPMSIGHLRSTLIGNSLIQIFKFLGYRTAGINYMGDYGTQFGKLIVAYNKWGSKYKKELEKNPIRTLLELYTKFHDEAEKDEKLEDEARREFKKLEEGNKKNLGLWKKFKDSSLKDFNKFYKLLGVNFDVISGESEYREKAMRLANELQKKGIAVESAGSLVIDLKDYAMPPCLLKKSDGATLYATRDLAAAIDRYNKYKFDKMLYVVGSEQRLHFQQVFRSLEILGHEWAKKCVHVNFGLIYLPEGGKISSRKGGGVFMDEVVEKIISMSRKLITSDVSEKEKDKIAEDVGISALIYGDLSNDRIRDVEFDWDKILRLEGDSGPYLQYSCRRAASILEKEKFNGKFSIENLNDEEKALITELSQFPKIIKEASFHYTPHIIANYSNRLAQLFSNFYEKCPVIKADEKDKQKRLAIVYAVKTVLANCLMLLGMRIPSIM
jgi:arginyl-tRNA synthetase